MTKVHYSDCAVHNAPAYAPGPCDCGGLELTEDAGHSLVARLVPGTGSSGFLVSDGDAPGFVQPHELPADRLVVNATAPDLPDAHNGISRCACPHCMNFDDPSEAVIGQFEASP
jgi:hypothetical protein